MYLLMDVCITYDLLKTGNVIRENICLNQIRLDNVQEVRMRLSARAANKHRKEERRLAHCFCQSSIPIKSIGIQ